MPPTLRSVTPATPPSKASAQPITPKSSERKVPHCRTCGRPRSGHPRQGCPYGDSPSAAPVNDDSPQAGGLTEALNSMQIEQSARGKNSSSRPRLSRPLQRTFHGEQSSDEENAVMNKWRTGIKMSTKSKPGRQEEGRLMPCTLDSPRTSISDPELTTTDDDAATKTDTEDDNHDIVGSSSVQKNGQQLIRSLSVEERALFLDGLAEIATAPPATVYVVPLAELSTLKASAAKVGFRTRSVSPVNGSTETGGLFIIGKDEKAVEKLYRGLSKDVKKKGIGAVQLASGAALGAATMFSALAFS